MAKYLTLSEMAEHLAISSRTLRRIIAQQSIPHIRIGRSMRFDPQRVELYLECTGIGNKPQRRTSGHFRETSKYEKLLGL